MYLLWWTIQCKRVRLVSETEQLTNGEFAEKVKELFGKFRYALSAKAPQAQVTLHQKSNIEYYVVVQQMFQQPQQFVIWKTRGGVKWGVMQ